MIGWGAMIFFFFLTVKIIEILNLKPVYDPLGHSCNGPLKYFYGISDTYDLSKRSACSVYMGGKLHIDSLN